MHLASAAGHMGIARELVSEGADPNALAAQNLTPMHYACGKGHLNMVKFLVENGARVAENDRRGRSYLHMASEKGHVEIVEWLASNYRHVDVKDDVNGGTPLHTACLSGHLGVVDVLVNLGSDVDIRNSDGMTALHCACVKGHIDIAKCLVEHGADPTVKDLEGNSPIDIASQMGYSSLINWLLYKMDVPLLSTLPTTTTMTTTAVTSTSVTSTASALGGGGTGLSTTTTTPVLATTSTIKSPSSADVDGPTMRRSLSRRLDNSVACLDCSVLFQFTQDNFLDNNNRDKTTNSKVLHIKSVMPASRANSTHKEYTHRLHDACMEGDVEGVKRMLEKGYSVNSLDPNIGSGPLHYACLSGQVAVTKLLIYSHANLELRNSNGLTPLLCAVERKQSDIVLLLIEKGADVTAKNKSGYTLLHRLSALGMAELLQSITDMPRTLLPVLDMESRTEHGLSPLHCAAENVHIDVVLVLITQSVQINTRDNDNRTPLHYAATYGHVEVSDALVTAGAFVNARDSLGLSPLLSACGGGHLIIAKMLLANGGSLGVQTEDGDTALHMACAAESFGVVLWLLEKDLDLSARNRHGLMPAQCIHDESSEVMELLVAWPTAKQLGKRVQEVLKEMHDARRDRQECRSFAISS